MSTVRELTTDADREAAVPVLRELFTGYERGEVRSFMPNGSTARTATSGGARCTNDG